MPGKSAKEVISQNQMWSGSPGGSVVGRPCVRISTQSDLDAEEVIRELEALCESMSEDLDVVTTSYQHDRYVVHVNTRAFVPNEVVQIRVIGRNILIQGRYFPPSQDAGSKKAKKYWRKLSFPSSTKLDTINTTLHDDGLCVIEGTVSEPSRASTSTT